MNPGLTSVIVRAVSISCHKLPATLFHRRHFFVVPFAARGTVTAAFAVTGYILKSVLGLPGACRSWPCLLPRAEHISMLRLACRRSPFPLPLYSPLPLPPSLPPRCCGCCFCRGGHGCCIHAHKQAAGANKTSRWQAHKREGAQQEGEHPPAHKKEGAQQEGEHPPAHKANAPRGMHD